MNKLRDILFWKFTESWDNNITIYLKLDFETFIFEDGQDYFESGRVISKNDLEGKQNHNVWEVQT